MPKAAQHLPDASMLMNEGGVVLEVCQCSKCGLVQLNNEPVSYYKEVIRASAFSADMRTFRLKQFKEFIEQYSLQNKKIIEMGCGKGEYLQLMKEVGADVYGIEFLDESVEFCRVQGLQVYKEYIDCPDISIPSAPFDAFFIMNFFEHIPDLNTALVGMSNNLSDDGVGIIEVPNFDMMLRNKMFSEFIGDHLFYFTKGTLASTLNINGFEVVECKEVWHDYIISAVVKKKKKTDLSNFHKQQKKIEKEICQYLTNYRPKQVAVWGAGHQAFAVLSLSKLGGRIKYVVDDAPFKQGKYTPATHIPIVSADALLSNAPEAIIVMAGSYSEEIVRKLKKRKKLSNIDVAILRESGLNKID
jgi:2-polyprenyl-3-methyl-5-hydroxy-6-metoxy-1,4-benzoquinol methylase